MTDQGPMQPDYRRRMEAALARVIAWKTVADERRCLCDEDATNLDCPYHGGMHPAGDDLALSVAMRKYDDLRARAEAAEQRVKELEAEREGFAAGWASQVKRAADAEAREQALRDELNTLRGNLIELVQVIETEEYTSPEAEGAAKYRGKQLDRILNPLSPPTADTEESDRG